MSPGPGGAANRRAGRSAPGVDLTCRAFHALMPPDDASTVAVGRRGQFPQNGPSKGGIVRRSSSASCVLGCRHRTASRFPLPVSERASFSSRSMGHRLAYTDLLKSNGDEQITGEILVTSTAANWSSPRDTHAEMERHGRSRHLPAGGMLRLSSLTSMAATRLASSGGSLSGRFDRVLDPPRERVGVLARGAQRERQEHLAEPVALELVVDGQPRAAVLGGSGRSRRSGR